jgi:hypothetical protein
MSWVTIEVDVDIDDFYREPSRSEKESLAQRLEVDGFYEVEEADCDVTGLGTKSDTLGEIELRENLTALWNSWAQLTKEEEKVIADLAKKFKI